MISNGYITITDPVFVKKDKYNAFERFFLKYINDERDLPFVKLSILLMLIFPPLALWMFIDFNWWVAAIYLFLNWAIFLGPFILMLHNTSHRSLFKYKYKWMNHIIPWFIGPFFGESPETYYAHHIAMHHPENNLEEDLSTTMPYRRDSIRGFTLYFLEFFFTTIGQLSSYLWRKNRKPIMWKMIIGELLYIALCIGLSFVNFKATLITLILPLFFTRLMMMAGNWAQHAFVDASSPGNPYRNSLTCINTPYNKKSWNDGYHISHHERANRHWTQHPQQLLDKIDTYIKEEAIVFQKIDFTTVWLFLMLKRYDWLAKHYVQLDPNNIKTKEEIIALLKQRTRPIKNRQYVKAKVIAL